MTEIVEGDIFNLKCANFNCCRTIKLICLNSSTMESMVFNSDKYIDLRNTEWRCFRHSLKTKKKNYHRKKKKNV